MIKAIYLSEFEESVGPQIRFFYPDQNTKLKELVKEKYEEFNDFINPKPELLDKLLTLIVSKKYLTMGVPHEVFQKEYKRSKIQFNTNFVIKIEDWKKYKITLESIFHKISKFLNDIEIDMKI